MSSKLRQKQKRKEKRKRAAIERIYQRAIIELDAKMERANFILSLRNEYGIRDPVPLEAQCEAKMQGIFGPGITD